MMPNYFDLTLDTIAPASPTVSINNGSAYLTATDRLTDLSISTTDTNTTDYKMKIWGDVDLEFNPNIQSTENDSNWITFATVQQIKVSDGDGEKRINIQIRDDVYNVSSLTTDTINLDTTLPNANITSLDVTKISKVVGKNECTFTFTCDSIFNEFKVKVVSSVASLQDTGVTIPMTNGSTNMSGTGNYPASTPIDCIIKGSDLELASAGDGEKIVKIFVKDLAGNWSV